MQFPASFLSAESGFRHVTPTEYTPRLLHFHGVKVPPLISLSLLAFIPHHVSEYLQC